MSRGINPNLAYPDGITNLMILAARGDVKTISELTITKSMVTRQDQDGYTARDYAVAGARLYLDSFVEEIALPFGRMIENLVTLTYQEKAKCADPKKRMVCSNYYREGLLKGTIHLDTCLGIYQKADWRALSVEGSLEEICGQINQMIPPMEWQQQALEFNEALPKKDRRLIESYLTTGYKEMNTRLRIDPDSDASLNRIIRRMIPLPNDILVFRGFDAKEYPKVPGTYTKHGYVSTSISEYRGPDGDAQRILRLIVPKGTRCLYLGSDEWEILLPHNSIIHILTDHLVKDPAINYQLIVYDGVLEAQTKD